MEFFIVSDSLNLVNAQMELNLLDFKGNSLNKWIKKLSVSPNQSKKYLEISENIFSSYGELDNMLINAKLISSNDKLLAENNIYFKSPKLLNLPSADISYKIFESKDKYEIILKSQNLAKNIFISSILTGNFSDNYFDLLPGDQKTISIEKNGFKDFNLFKSSIKVVSLRDTY
jgi:beta-mannosidase